MAKKKVLFLLAAVVIMVIVFLAIYFITDTNKVDVKINGQIVELNVEEEPYDVQRGQEVVIISKDTTTKYVAYQVGTKEIRSEIIEKGEIATFKIPSNIYNGVFTFQVSTYGEEKWGKVQMYYLNMTGQDVFLELDGKELSDNNEENPYEISVGKEMKIKTYPYDNIIQTAYKFGTGETYQINEDEILINIPKNTQDNNGILKLQISSYNSETKEWITPKNYYFKIVG